MLKPATIPNAVLLIGVSCLGLAVTLAIAQAFLPQLDIKILISTLSDAFKLCLGALLALLNNHGHQRRSLS